MRFLLTVAAMAVAFTAGLFIGATSTAIRQGIAQRAQEAQRAASSTV